ncbi:hypothetical protein [Salinibacterium sp. SWN1162]|uniref:hypothetical protein n=1 Tax=Salinibacterium sp. SWN1162 TaxID=2792053 RepID=UPI0018CD577F|nr:hypothetical protein [Salinibacterium sp. SWN1162]MBH0007920.1 hypothetical protein [Salinibacterium sp. SWN1162]
MFWFVTFLVIGIATGIALSKARTPVIRYARTFVVFAVGTGLILLIVVNSTASAQLTFVYATAVVLTELSWTARIWGSLFPESGLLFHQVFLDELVAPNRIRIAYAQLLLEREREHLEPEEPNEPDDLKDPDDPEADPPPATPPTPPSPRGFPF